jgi:hypothetical protein
VNWFVILTLVLAAKLNISRYLYLVLCKFFAMELLPFL